MGQLMCVAFNYAPKGWMFCNGQLLSIAQNSGLFSLIGLQYGGDGITTFALPNLQGRVSMHFGQGPGLPEYPQGSVGGTTAVTLTVAELPSHNHPLAAGTSSTQSSPLGALPGPISTEDGQPILGYAHASAGTMASNSVGASGGNLSHPNMQPYLVLNWIIAVEGIYPPRSQP